MTLSPAPEDPEGTMTVLESLELKLSLVTKRCDDAEWKIDQIDKMLVDRGYSASNSIGYRIKTLCDMADELKALKEAEGTK